MPSPRPRRPRLGLPPSLDGAAWRFARFERPLMSHRHAELEMNLVTQGRATYLVGDARYELREGTMIWLFPGQEHLLLDRSPHFAMWILVARPALVRRVCRGEVRRVLTADDPPGRFCRRLPAAAASRLGVLMAELSSITAQVERHNAGIAYALLSAWVAFVLAPAAEDRAASAPLHPAVERAARLLRDDPGAENELAAVAARAGLSPARLSARFKAQVGVTLSAYRSRQRLDRFVELWTQRGGSSTVLELALEAGFGSYAQFYRVVRRELGCGPAEFAARPVS